MTTTDERMALIELVGQQADGHLVREMLAFAAERIMEAEVPARTGATKGARSPMREFQRNGYRDRDWDPRAGRIALEIPKLRPLRSAGRVFRDRMKCLLAFDGAGRGDWPIRGRDLLDGVPALSGRPRSALRGLLAAPASPIG